MLAYKPVELMDSAESDSDYCDWMSALPEKLWDIPLSNLAIPGKDTYYIIHTYF